MTCTLCPLHKTARTVCIDGTGSDRPALLFVGAGPDMADDRSGVAFSGTNGHLLRDMLEPLVFPWRATNAIRCATPFGREPHIDEAEACRTYLAAEIALTRPEAIVALGNGALKTLTNTSGVGKNRGKLIDMRVSLRKEIERAAPRVFCVPTDNRDALIALGFERMYPQAATGHESRLWVRSVDSGYCSGTTRNGRKLIVQRAYLDVSSQRKRLV